MRPGDGRCGLRAARRRGLPPRRGRIRHDRCQRSTDAAESRIRLAECPSSPSSCPASPTRARSRARPGPRRCARCCTPGPTACSATAIDRAWPSCGSRWPRTWLDRVPWWPIRRAIVIFGSFASALSVLASTLHHLGVSHIAVEDPGLPPHRKVIEAGGPTIVPVPVDDDGLCVDQLDQAERRRVHSRPPVPDRRRAARPPAVSPSSTGPDTATAGSSKTITTASSATTDVRSERCKVSTPTASSMAAPRASRSHPASDSRGSCSRQRCSSRCSTPCESGATPCRRSNKPLSPSSSCPGVWTDTCAPSAFTIDVDVTRCCACLTHSAPWLHVTGVSAGLHVTAYLDDRDEREVIELAGRRSVALFGIADHSIVTPTRRGLVIGYSRSPAHAFPQALQTLAGILDAQRIV